MEIETITKEMTKIEIVTIIISSIAIIISIIGLITSIISIWDNRKTARASLQAEYFNSIFKEFIITKIPEARKPISINNQTRKLVGCDKMLDLIDELNKKNIYLAYYEKKFYNKLSEKLNHLEDYLVDRSNMSSISIQDEPIVLAKINENISGIYKEMFSQYYLIKTRKNK